MTTEQDNQRVSDSYRDIATQTTPAALDEKVLKLAASAVPSRYGLARAWVRPLAWAATIALSLAIVLQVTRLDDAPLPATREELPAQEAVAEPRARSDADLMKAKEEKDVQRGSAAQQAPAAAPVSAVVLTDEMAPLREAEDRARLQSSAAAAAETAVDDVHCDAEARAQPDTWLACIEALRTEGLTDFADSELEVLREAFPAFLEGRE